MSHSPILKLMNGNFSEMGKYWELSLTITIPRVTKYQEDYHILGDFKKMTQLHFVKIIQDLCPIFR